MWGLNWVHSFVSSMSNLVSPPSPLSGSLHPQTCHFVSSVHQNWPCEAGPRAPWSCQSPSCCRSLPPSPARGPGGGTESAAITPTIYLSIYFKYTHHSTLKNILWAKPQLDAPGVSCTVSPPLGSERSGAERSSCEKIFRPENFSDIRMCQENDISKNLSKAD